MNNFQPDRRKFLKLSAGVAGSSLIIGVNWSCSSERPNDIDEDKFRPNAWLKIDPQGIVSVIVAESEMGQGPYTGLATILADELDLDWQDVRVERAPLDPVYGHQSTGGSTSIRKGWVVMRQAGAIAREMLRQAAAQVWQVPVSECETRLSRVEHSLSDRSLSYAELIPRAKNIAIPENVSLKATNQFRIIGKPISRLDAADKINGKAQFGIDIRLPGMQYATITHCPVFGGKLKQVEKTKALEVEGVIDVFTIDEGVVVLAKDTWSAFKGRNALEIEWDFGDKASLSSDSIIDSLREMRADDSTVVTTTHGDPNEVLKGDSLEREYIFPFQAHMTMEPMNCTAHLQNGKLRIWAPTQSPSGALETANSVSRSKLTRGINKVKRKLFDWRDDSIEINTTLLGGGFGRRLEQDYVAEVTQIAEHTESPVQLIWTREEDIQHDFYHPLTMHEIKGRLDENGMPLAWHHTIKGPKPRSKGSSQLPYKIPHTRIDLIKSPNETIPIGYWRAVEHTYNVFAVEHFFDELARSGNQDPLELRLKLLSAEPRLRKTLEIAADLSGWSNESSMFGVASAEGFGSYTTEIVELKADKDRLSIAKVTCVIDCGIAINPDIIKAQMEGSIVFGLTAALKSSISFKHGRTEQSNYRDHPILSMAETPPIEVFIVDSTQNPGGVGEPGVPPLAPALANAILAANGSATHHLPLDLKMRAV